MPLYSVYVNFVRAKNAAEAREKGVQRWDAGDDGDSTGHQDIQSVEVEKETKKKT
jgi:hypothetical protein